MLAAACTSVTCVNAGCRAVGWRSHSHDFGFAKCLVRGLFSRKGFAVQANCKHPWPVALLGGVFGDRGVPEWRESEAA